MAPTKGKKTKKARPARAKSPKISTSDRQIGKVLNLLRWAFVIFLAVFGNMISNEGDSSSETGRFLHLLPLLLQFVKPYSVYLYGIWLGVFLLLQSFTSYWVSDDFKTLPPQMLKQVRVTSQGFPGIDGVQKITTDEKGFRVNPRVQYQDKKKEDYRIFAIGASTTEELFLDDKKTWTHLLQEGLKSQTSKNVQVINTGVSGLRIRHHLATFQEILSYEPDVVLFLVGVNDWNRQIEEHFGSKKPEDLTAGKLEFKRTLLGKLLQRMGSTPKAPPQTQGGDQGVIYDDGSFYGWKAKEMLGKPERSYKIHNVYKDYEVHLEKIMGMCQRASFKCVFMNQPHAYRTYTPQSLKNRFWMYPPKTSYRVDFQSMEKVADFYNQYIEKMAKDSQQEFCDLTAALSPPSEAFFWDEVHYNEGGARKVAETLQKCLAKAVATDL